MPFTPCKDCPRPDWCSSGAPGCEKEQAGLGVYIDPGEAPAMVEPEAITVPVRWPLPAEFLARGMPGMAEASAWVWGFIMPDDDMAAAGDRHDTIIGAATDAARLIDERTATLRDDGSSPPAATFAAVCALVASYMVGKWAANPPSTNEAAAGLTSILGTYAHAIAIQMMRELQARGIVPAPEDEPQEAPVDEAEEIAARLRG